MKKSIFWIGGISALFLFGSCVESSQKYKSLQSQMDSLQVAYNAQTTETVSYTHLDVYKRQGLRFDHYRSSGH